MSDAAATTAAPSGGAQPGAPLAGAVSPAEVHQQSRRLSEMEGPAPGMVDLRAEVAGGDPATAPTEPAPEGEPAPEQPPEVDPEQPTPEQLAAEWQKHRDSPDLDVEAFGDKVLWVKDRDGNPVPLRVRDVERQTLLYRDYQHKTTELARERRAVEAQQQGMQAFQRDLLSGDPQTALKAMRWIGADKSMHAMVVSYVQRMAQLEGMPDAIRQQFLEGERARDRAEQLERQLAARQQQEQQLAQQQAAEQGINAPDIQHVMQHVEQRLPDICKQLGVVQSDVFDRELGDRIARAAEGERGADGRWTTAPTIQRGRTPTDDVLRQLVGAAWEETQRLIARASGLAPKPKLPPPPAAAAVTGPAAKPGQRGNISQPERKRWSDMDRPVRR